MRRIVPVPETARSAHAVFTAEPLEPGADELAPPPPLLKRFGATDEQLTRLAERPFARAFVSESPLADAAEILAATRREALQHADEHDGVVVDLTIPRIVTHDAADIDLAVASQWVAVDIDLAAQELSTRGLEAFGLPEVVAREVTGDTMVHLIGLVMGVAHRLILEWPANDPVGPAAITLRDVGRGFGDSEAEIMPTEPATDVLLSYSDGVLVVVPVDDPAAMFEIAE